MSDGEHGALLELRADRRLDEVVRLQIHCGRRLVQHEDFGFAQECARKADELALSHTQVLAALTALKVEAVGQTGHVLLEVGVLQRHPQVSVRSLFKRVEIGAQRARKQDGFLQRETDCF